MAATTRLCLALSLGLLIVPSVVGAQTYDFEVVSEAVRLDVHPAVALPGETVVLRLVIRSEGFRPNMDELPSPQSAAEPRPARGFDEVSITITDHTGETVLEQHQVIDSGSCAPGRCGALAEWSLVWNPGRLAPGLYRAHVVAADGDGDAPMREASAEFLLEEPAAMQPDPPQTSPGLAAGDTLDIPEPLTCRVEARPLRVHPGETVEIILTVTNHTGEPARRFFPDNGVLGYALLDHQDRVVATSDQGPEDRAAWLDLAPGESIQRRWSLTWVLPATPSAEIASPLDGPYAILHADRYYLRAGLGAYGERESAPWVDLVLWRPSAYSFHLD